MLFNERKQINFRPRYSGGAGRVLGDIYRDVRLNCGFILADSAITVAQGASTLS